MSDVVEVVRGLLARMTRIERALERSAAGIAPGAPLGDTAGATDPGVSVDASVGGAAIQAESALTASIADIGRVWADELFLNRVEALLDRIDPRGSGLDGSPKVPLFQRLHDVVEQRHGVLLPVLAGEGVSLAAMQDGRCMVVTATVLSNDMAWQTGAALEAMARQNAPERA